MHVVESLGNLLRMCEMWSLAMKNRAFWHGNKCLHSYSTVRAWRNWKVCANVTSCRCAFGLIVSNRLNLYYKRHLDSHIIGYRYNAVQYIMLMHTVLQWQQQTTNQTLNSQKTLYHVQAMGCLLCVGIWGKYIIMIPSHCIWIFLKHNSLRPNDASVNYIIIGWYNGFSLARRQAII